MSSQQGLQQLTLEKEQAMSDLNSVERSLSELFRRYENMKGVLEGYKKVPVLLFCDWFDGGDLKPTAAQSE